MYGHDPYCLGVVFFKINTWINALESLTQVKMWSSWQFADKCVALSFRSWCLYCLWAFISSHWTFLPLFSSESWKKAMVSLEARNLGQFTSLWHIRCLVPVLHYNPSKFIDCGEPQISQNSWMAFSPLNIPEGALVNSLEAEAQEPEIIEFVLPFFPHTASFVFAPL